MILIHPRPRALQRFADGEAGDPARAGIASHLAACSRCRATVAFTRDLERSARTLDTPRAPASLIDRIHTERAEGHRKILPATSEPRASRNDRRWLAAAAAIIVAVSALAVGRRADPRDRPSPPDVAAADTIPTLHGMLITVGVLPSSMYAQEAPAAPAASPIGRIDGDTVHPMTMEYELTWTGNGQKLPPPERGWASLERATYQGVRAWRITTAWRGHDTDLPETTYVDRRSLHPLARVARNVGFSHYTVTQRFVGDSLVGLMRGSGREHKIARALPPERAPFLAGEGAPLLLFRSVKIDRDWRGSASIVGWGAVPSDLIYPIEIRVVGEERVTVPAGTFDCWKLAITDKRHLQNVWLRKSDLLAVMSRDADKSPGKVQQIVLLSAGTPE